MKIFFFSAQILLFALILGCSSKDYSLNRILYNTGQGYDQQQCQENPTAKCGNKKSYDQYKKEREEILKEKKSIETVVSENQALHTCPYPGEPINWVLRACALENHTDDEISLQKTPCFELALVDLHSKANACKIKEKYKRQSCKMLVERYRTQESVILCLEDHSIKPFFAGN